MIRRSIFLLSFLVALGIQSCIKENQNTAEELDNANARLELILALDKTSYLPSEQITATLTLKNNGDYPVLVKQRLGYGTIAPDVVFMILGPLGLQSSPGLFISAAPLENDDYVKMDPGDSYSRKYPFDLAFNFKNVGVYTIQVSYQNETDPSDGRVAWKGKLISNIIEINVMP